MFVWFYLFESVSRHRSSKLTEKWNVQILPATYILLYSKSVLRKNEFTFLFFSFFSVSQLPGSCSFFVRFNYSSAFTNLLVIINFLSIFCGIFQRFDALRTTSPVILTNISSFIQSMWWFLSIYFSFHCLLIYVNILRVSLMSSFGCILSSFCWVCMLM